MEKRMGLKTVARSLRLTALIALCVSAAGQQAIAATDIYRSVGNTTSALATGGGSTTMTIAGSTATFGAAIANKVGVGDAIQYDSGGTTTMNSIVFISGRTSSTVYTVKKFDGSAPTATAGNVNWSIFRAYTGLHASTIGSENTGIDNAVRDFDTWTTGVNLVTSDFVWHVACYGDAADTTNVSLNINAGWTTDATRYVHIYTPVSSTEVGVSQRHPGYWDATKYNLSVTVAGTGYTLDAGNMANLIVDGLQVYRNYNSAGGTAVRYELSGSPATMTFTLSNSIIRGQTGSSNSIGLGIGTDNTATIKVYNNVIYDHNLHGIKEYSYKAGGIGGATYIYNNTVANVTVGMFVTGSNNDGRSVVAKNNIVQNASSKGYDGSNGAPYWGGNFAAASDRNLSNKADSPGTNAQNTKTVTFSASGSGDFRLASGDTAAKDLGGDLSADANIPFSTDLEGETRSGSWDIGADEYIVPTSMTVSSLSTGSVTVSGFAASLNFTGDSDADSTGCTFYYCNHTDSPSCDAVATGTSGAMTRNASTYTLTISGLTNPNNPGDTLNIAAACGDPDGITGSPLTNTVTLASAGVNSLTTSALGTSGITTSAFNASINFAGDANTNGTCTFYYCDNTASAGCSAAAGSSTAMTRGAGVFTAAISGLTVQASGHQYNIRTTCADADGVSADLTGTVTLLSDTLAPKPPSPVSVQ